MKSHFRRQFGSRLHFGNLSLDCYGEHCHGAGFGNDTLTIFQLYEIHSDWQKKIDLAVKMPETRNRTEKTRERSSSQNQLVESPLLSLENELDRDCTGGQGGHAITAMVRHDIESTPRSASKN